MMDSGWKPSADERISEVVRGELAETAPFLTGWVLVVTYSDDAGESCTGFNSMEGLKRSQTLGMLTYALEVERAAIFWAERPDGDGS